MNLNTLQFHWGRGIPNHDTLVLVQGKVVAIIDQIGFVYIVEVFICTGG